MKVITGSELLNYNQFKTPAIMDGDEGIAFEAEEYMKKATAEDCHLTLAKSASFFEHEIKTRPKAAMEKIFKDSLISAGSLGLEAILVEPFMWDKKHSLDKEEIKRFYLNVADILKEVDITIYIKNQYDLYNGSFNRGFLSDAYQLKEFIEKLNEKAPNHPFKLALDTGVANLCGQNIPELIETLIDEIGIIIPIENNGQEDSAALPFSNISQSQGWIDWVAVIKRLRKINYQGDILMDTGAATGSVPASLRPVLSNHTREIANYFEALISMEAIIRKYDKKVLFGAGNMCRVYMEHFREDNPPLFTCDNNQGKWGATAYGLEIKSPQCLKELAPDTAIVICNMFYDEIIAQLKSMNLPNPVVIFNDEIL